MKRFYKQVAVVAKDDEFYTITLDGRPMHSPGRAPLALPTEALANCVAEEWREQLEEIAKTKMKDLNANDIEAASRIIEGSARSMGLKIEG